MGCLRFVTGYLEPQQTNACFKRLRFLSRFTGCGRPCWFSWSTSWAVNAKKVHSLSLKCLVCKFRPYKMSHICWCKSMYILSIFDMWWCSPHLGYQHPGIWGAKGWLNSSTCGQCFSSTVPPLSSSPWSNSLKVGPSKIRAVGWSRKLGGRFRWYFFQNN